jgi:hypothetical protein
MAAADMLLAGLAAHGMLVVVRIGYWEILQLLIIFG